jgi:hypothetical protein
VKRSILSLGIAITLSLLACSGSSSDAAPNGDTGDEQDATAAKFWVAQPGPGPFVVKLANRTKTACGDGTSSATCTVFMVDYSALNLSASDQAKLDGAFRAGHAIVQGKLDVNPDDDRAKKLVAAAAWTGAGGKDVGSFDSYYRVTGRILNGMCVHNACGPLTSQQLLNKSGGAEDVAVDLTQANATKAEQADGATQYGVGQPGLLVAGIDHTLVHGEVGVGVSNSSTLVATDFYLPVVASAPPSGAHCPTIRCASGFHCEEKGINGGTIGVCLQN